MKKYCIVIPIYKEELNICEELSLNQLIKVCKDSDIYLIHPQKLDISNYSKKYNYNFLFKKFDNNYFKSIRSYNSFCLSYDLYNAFSNYEYMLIYQLDCWLFEDNIEEWCDKGYDYVGPPILSRNSVWINMILENNTTPQVGNGGFSLRKISTMKEIFDREGEIFNSMPFEIQNIFNDLNIILPEDDAICNLITKYYFLNIPHWEESAAFGWDWSVEVLNNKFKKLPMGCHALFKQYKFWKDFIPELNNEDIQNFINDDWNEDAKNAVRQTTGNILKQSHQIIAILREDNVL